MPCRDYYDDHPEAYYKEVTEPEFKKRIAFAESALCEALRTIEYLDSQIETISPKTGDFYDWINCKEAGITKKDLVRWHKNHKLLDEKSRQAEKAKKLKETALSKLTEEEKIVLGLK